jgi:hypothetical protein
MGEAKNAAHTLMDAVSEMHKGRQPPAAGSRAKISNHHDRSNFMNTHATPIMLAENLWLLA